MTTIQTIRRNTKRYAAILDTATDCKVYTLDNYFIGADCNPLALVQYMAKDAFLPGKLTTNSKGDRRYTLHIHSNCWFEFSATA